jgi:tetratricopeptide (TPR) repeat protein
MENTGISEIELKELIQQLEENSTDTNLMNKVALGYMANPLMIDDQDDLKLFEKAYKTRKTIKSTNNLAWQLFFEWGEEERAFEIQKECISLNPKSYIPYFLYGYILTHRKEYTKALEILKTAYSKKVKQEIALNIGVAHYRNEDFKNAKVYFELGTKDTLRENKGLFNLAVTELKQDNLENSISILKNLELNIDWEFGDIISGYEIASVYAYISDYENASRCAIKQGLNGIDLCDWTDIGYSLWKTNRDVYMSTIETSIEEKEGFLKEIEDGHEDWEHESDDEKKESIELFKNEIESLNLLENQFEKEAPKSKIDVWEEYCGCLMFDCPCCGNQSND